MVEAALRRARPNLEVVTQIISTRGDLRTAEPLDPRAGRKGLFTGEIERALAAGEIDVAVHSAKDLPSEMTPGLEIGATLPRASVEDVLIRKESGEVRGAIATGSVRRQHQLRCKFPRVEILDLRGNVPTRLRKFLQSDWQAIVLARAGLERLGFDLTRNAFEFDGVSLRWKRCRRMNFAGWRIESSRSK
jgi:hydroxymethylbilane synthase